jgi:hypothetical protein
MEIYCVKKIPHGLREYEQGHLKEEEEKKDPK